MNVEWKLCEVPDDNGQFAEVAGFQLTVLPFHPYGRFGPVQWMWFAQSPSDRTRRTDGKCTDEATAKGLAVAAAWLMA